MPDASAPPLAPTPAPTQTPTPPLAPTPARSDTGEIHHHGEPV